MPLLAADPATWSAVALAAVAAVGSFMTAVLGYLRDRDKLRYDAQLAALEVKTDACHEERDGLKAQNTGQQAQINDLYRLLGRQPDQHPSQPQEEA